MPMTAVKPKPIHSAATTNPRRGDWRGSTRCPEKYGIVTDSQTAFPIRVLSAKARKALEAYERKGWPTPGKKTPQKLAMLRRKAAIRVEPRGIIDDGNLRVLVFQAPRRKAFYATAQVMKLALVKGLVGDGLTWYATPDRRMILGRKGQQVRAYVATTRAGFDDVALITQRLGPVSSAPQEAGPA